MKKKSSNKQFPCKIAYSFRILLILTALWIVQTGFPMHTFAQTTGKTVTIHVQNQTVRNLLQEIQKQTGINFAYNEKILSSYTSRSLDVTEQSVEKTLQLLFEGTDLTYSIDGNTVTIYRKKQHQNVGHKKVKGKITDEQGAPLPGVAVLIVGTSIGTASDIDGNYSLDIPDNVESKLQFSMIGMELQEIAVGSRTIIDVVLREAHMEMDEVVVTGIFKKARESYTGAVSTIRKDKLRMFKGQNMLQTLRNIDASLNISMNNAFGSDPNQLPQMNIRGTSSLPMSIDELNENTRQSVNTPLIIMDGFEITLTKLMDYNDEEIESITILKDASATAIYGSRGANGVIVVTSRKPEEGKLRVTAKIGLTAEIPDLTSYDLLNAAEKLDLENRIGLYESKDNPSQTAERQQQYNKRLKDVLAGVNTDWLSQPLHNGVGGQYNLRLEGGREEFRWGTSISYKNTAGAMKGSARRVFNGDLTLMYVYKSLTFKNNTSISNVLSRNSPYGTFSTYVQQQPYNRIYDDNGKLIRWFDGFYANDSETQNPLYDAQLNTFDKSKTLSLINNFAIDWEIKTGLTLRGQLGISTNRLNSDKFYPAEHSKFSDKSVYPVGSSRKGSYTYGTGDDFAYDARLTLSYSKVFNEVHQLYAGLDYSVSENKSKSYSFEAEGFSNADLSFIGNALQYAKDKSPSASKNVSRRVGYTANVNYTYDNRYYVDFSFRTDGSSQFGADKRYAPFWSVGIGWNVHQERFMGNVAWINSFRLKASVGETGAMDFSKSDVLTMYSYPAGARYGLWNVADLQGLGNPALTWQKTDASNIGMEFEFFNRRLFGSFDYYTKVTKGLVSSMSLPLSMGFSSYSENVGEVKNAGYELSLGGYLVRNDRFSWTVNGQLVYNKNRISKLSDAIKAQNETFLTATNDDGDALLSDSEPATLLFEGRPQYGIYAVRSLGIDPATGNEMFLDRDGNVTNTWSTKDRVYCGQDGTYSSPYRGNLSTLVRWKNLSFSLSCSFQWGGKMYNTTLRDRVEVTTRNIMYYNVDRRVYTDRWLQADDAVAFKKIETYGTESYRSKATSRFVMDDNWFEIQTAGLEYRWATPGLKKNAGAQSILFGVTMNNLWHFSSVRYERGTSYPFARNLQGSVTILF